MLTIEVAGRPTVVINAQEEDDIVDDVLKQDLMLLENGGKPLWSGDDGDLFVRRSSDEEVATWAKAFSQARSEGAATDEDRDGYPVFLVPVRDTTADELDDTEAEGSSP